jgi:phosphocarrier protein
MQIKEVTVTNALGLHARASAKIVDAASRFPCTVSLVARGRRASARSIVALMLLSASAGTLVQLEADGPEEAAAVREIASLFSDGFGEHA